MVWLGYTMLNKLKNYSKRWSCPTGGMVKQRLEQKHLDLSDNWKTCALGERIHRDGADLKGIKDLSPDAIRLGYDFSVALQ